MKIRTALLAIATFPAVAVPMAVAATPPADAWDIGPIAKGKNYSVGMPSHPSPGRDGSAVFNFPRAGGEVGAMTTAVRPLAGAQRITFKYRIDAAPGTRFVSVESPHERATVSLYFQRAGDNWTARGRYGSYRWYAPEEAVVPISPGEHTVVINLDDDWSNVNSQPSHTVPAEYSGALRNTARIGIAFGSMSLRAHGVYATGPARFTLLALDID